MDCGIHSSRSELLITLQCNNNKMNKLEINIRHMIPKSKTKDPASLSHAGVCACAACR